jgi:hypothetical protein
VRKEWKEGNNKRIKKKRTKKGRRKTTNEMVKATNGTPVTVLVNISM